MGTGHFDSKEKRAAKMERRYGHHKSYGKLADEFETSKSTAHRTVSPRLKSDKPKSLASAQDMGRGYSKKD